MSQTKIDVVFLLQLQHQLEKENGVIESLLRLPHIETGKENGKETGTENEAETEEAIVIVMIVSSRGLGLLEAETKVEDKIQTEIGTEIEMATGGAVDGVIAVVALAEIETETVGDPVWTAMLLLLLLRTAVKPASGAEAEAETETKRGGGMIEMMISMEIETDPAAAVPEGVMMVTETTTAGDSGIHHHLLLQLQPHHHAQLLVLVHGLIQALDLILALRQRVVLVGVTLLALLLQLVHQPVPQPLPHPHLQRALHQHRHRSLAHLIPLPLLHVVVLENVVGTKFLLCPPWSVSMLRMLFTLLLDYWCLD